MDPVITEKFQSSNEDKVTWVTSLKYLFIREFNHEITNPFSVPLKIV